MKKVLITMIIAIAFLTASAYGIIKNSYNRGELYTMRGTVVEVNETTHTTSFIDDKGELWAFQGIKNWHVNDKIKVIVNSNNTTDFHDDKVIGAEKIVK